MEKEQFKEKGKVPTKNSFFVPKVVCYFPRNYFEIKIFKKALKHVLLHVISKSTWNVKGKEQYPTKNVKEIKHQLTACGGINEEGSKGEPSASLI